MWQLLGRYLRPSCPTALRIRFMAADCGAIQSDAEHRLWWRLRGGQTAGVRFRRQEPLGPYVVDFCSLTYKLVVEIDGGQHAEQGKSDARRTQFLQRLGYRVLRFWNHEVLQDTDAVVERIVAELGVFADSGGKDK